MENELSELRRELDLIDDEIMRLFEKRMEISKKVGEYKRMHSLPVEDPEREAEVIAMRVCPLPDEIKAGGERLVETLMQCSKELQKKGLNLYLIGMPDSGKTRMGKKLAQALQMPLVDTDKLIMEKTGLTIDAIFQRLSEEGFREMETALLKSIVRRGGLIAATGGGMPIREENARLLRGSGVVVFLDRALDKLHGQNTKNRPLLAADSIEETNAKIDRLYNERREKYLACADLAVDPDEEGAAELILGFIEKDGVTNG